MSAFDDLEEEIKRGLAGKNSGISMGFHKLNKYIGIRKKIYSMIFGASGSGKTAFVHSAFILNPFDWYIEKGRHQGVKLKIPLFAMERGKVYTKAKWLSRKIFLNEGIKIPLAKMLGWWDTKMNHDEHDLVMSYSDYINELCEVVDIIEGGQNPTAIYKYIKKLAEDNGRIEDIDEYHKVYIPNDEGLIVIPIVDHMGLTRTEKGMSKKEAIDKMSEHLQRARDFYGYSPVIVAQINRNLSNPLHQKLESFEPTVDDIKESGSPGEAADVIMSLFDPKRFGTEDTHYKVDKFIDPATGANHFRRVKLLKSTYSEDGIGIGMAFQGVTGIFAELPGRKDMEDFDYNKFFTGQYFLQEQNKVA